jgi:hypothetical protein
MIPVSSEGGDGDDDEEVVGWLLISDGEQIVVPHPEGQTHEGVVEAFATARKKKHTAFVLGKYVFDPEVITTFGWSEDIRFPEMEKFDGLQDRLEMIVAATAELSQNQAALQQAQAMLFQEEMEEMQAEAHAEAMQAAAQAQAQAPQALPPTPAPQAKPRKGGFKPPSA